MSGLGRAFAAAQARYDNLAPREIDEDELTDDQALQQARDEWLGTAASVADWLAKETDNDAGWRPADVFALCGSGNAEDAVATDALTIGQLLAIVMLGDAASVVRATFALRDRVALGLRDDIRGRADELLDAQERLQRNIRDEWEMERAA